MLRVMTYNVHGGIGTDRQLNLERIAQVIAEYQPDIVALQELDVALARSGRIHQAKIIAEILKMEFRFHAAMTREVDGEYGDALLSRWPLRMIKADRLPTYPSRLAFEPRGALWAAIETPIGPVQVINTHLGLSAGERLAQIDALLGEDWIGARDIAVPLILCGDFNALPLSLAYRRAASILCDAQKSLPGHRALATFPSRWPILRLDHILSTHDLAPQKIVAPKTPLTRIASDHLPLIVDLAPVVQRDISNQHGL